MRDPVTESTLYVVTLTSSTPTDPNSAHASRKSKFLLMNGEVHG